MRDTIFVLNVENLFPITQRPKMQVHIVLNLRLVEIVEHKCLKTHIIV